MIQPPRFRAIDRVRRQQEARHVVITAMDSTPYSCPVSSVTRARDRKGWQRVVGAWLPLATAIVVSIALGIALGLGEIDGVPSPAISVALLGGLPAAIYGFLAWAAPRLVGFIGIAPGLLGLAVTPLVLTSPSWGPFGLGTQIGIALAVVGVPLLSGALCMKVGRPTGTRDIP